MVINSHSNQSVFCPTRKQVSHSKGAQVLFGGLATLAGTMAGSNYYLLSSQSPKTNLPIVYPNQSLAPALPGLNRFDQPVGVKYRPVAQKQVKFGTDPLIWLISTSGATLVSKGTEYLLDTLTQDLRDNPRAHSKRVALEYLELARRSNSTNGSIFYLEKAEHEFLKLSETKWMDCDKRAQVYKDLAIIAKMLGRDSRVVDYYVERCMACFIQYGHCLQNEYDMDTGGTPEFPCPNLEIDGKIERYYSDDTIRVCNKLHSSANFQHYQIQRKPTIDEAFEKVKGFFKKLFS